MVAKSVTTISKKAKSLCVTSDQAKTVETPSLKHRGTSSRQHRSTINMILVETVIKPRD